MLERALDLEMLEIKYFRSSLMTWRFGQLSVYSTMHLVPVATLLLLVLFFGALGAVLTMNVFGCIYLWGWRVVACRGVRRQVSTFVKNQAQEEAEHFESPVLEYARMTTALKTALHKRHEKKITYKTAAHDLEAKEAHRSKVVGMGADREVRNSLLACLLGLG